MPSDRALRASGSRPSVLILNWRDTGHPEGGGSEYYVERVAAGLVEQGFEVTVFCSAYPGAPAAEQRDDGVRMVRSGGRFGVYLRAVQAFRAGRLGTPDVVLEVHNGVPFLARLWARRLPVVVLVHHVHREQWPVVFGPVRARLGWWLESKIAPRVNRGSSYVTVSEASRRELVGLGVSAENIEVLHNGTEPAPSDRFPRADTPALLVLGRLVPHKRVEIAIAAAVRLRAEFPDLLLTVAGRGWWADALRARVTELGAADYVHFSGQVSTAARHRLYAENWLLLVPSVKEGWGLVVVEAGIHGTPTVAFSGAGGLQESIVDGRTGVLVPESDDIAFADAIAALLRDEQRRQRLGDEATVHAAQFAWETTVKGFAELLDSVVATGGSRRRPWLRSSRRTATARR